MKRNILNSFLGIFALAILVSCSQTQELASNEQEAPRYRKVYYKNKIIYKDVAPKTEDVKLDLEDAQVAQIQEETPEVIAPLTPAASETNAPERKMTADREAKVWNAPFGNLDKNFPMLRHSDNASADAPDNTNDINAGLGWSMIVLGVILIVIAAVLDIGIIYAVGSVILVVGLVLLLLGLIA